MSSNFLSNSGKELHAYYTCIKKFECHTPQTEYPLIIYICLLLIFAQEYKEFPLND